MLAPAAHLPGRGPHAAVFFKTAPPEHGVGVNAMQAPPKRIALQRDVEAASLDPWTRAEIARRVLPAGTVLEDPETALAEAEVAHRESVVVRTVDGDGWFGLQRIATASLRRAVGSRLTG